MHVMKTGEGEILNELTAGDHGEHAHARAIFIRISSMLCLDHWVRGSSRTQAIQERKHLR